MMREVVWRAVRDAQRGDERAAQWLAAVGDDLAARGAVGVPDDCFRARFGGLADP
jgi:hypothetical protein